jgi:hypothetical protein
MSHSFGGRARDGFDADASGNEPPASGAVDKSSSSPETYLRKKRNVFFQGRRFEKRPSCNPALLSLIIYYTMLQSPLSAI